ncbi:MAG: methyltransferase domain-containing protein [Kofleriaceae bacterium]|nr:MAG: methyltransferase domain-containing protein [Kofleriaceae bacterium]MBZ0236947.1 methyltransferase domain-containing protein [Kofleriaceae bacterium]
MEPATHPSSVETAPRDLSSEEQSYYTVNRAEWAWFSRYYDAVTRPLRQLRGEVVAAVAAPPGSRILDVATGTGEQALAFAPGASEVIGLDMSEAMLAIARRKERPPNVDFVLGDAAQLPFPAGRFDVACISFALHEMPPSIRDQVVREMARVTRHGGTLAIVDYALPPGRIVRSIIPRLIGLYERPYYAAFVRSDLPALLEGAGVAVRSDRRAFWGNARILVGDKVA